MELRPFWRRSSLRFEAQRRAAILPKDGTTAHLPMLMGRSFLGSRWLKTRASQARHQLATSAIRLQLEHENRIIDIAFAVGSGDVSHFNRMFRRRFGETPSGVRAASTMREQT